MPTFWGGLVAFNCVEVKSYVSKKQHFGDDESLVEGVVALYT